MCKVLIREKLKKRLDLKALDELIEYAFKIENFTKDNSGSHKRKKLNNSKDLWRIHLAGSTRRVIYTYKEDKVKIYELLDVTDDQKYRAYDKVTKNYEKLSKELFVDITPPKENKISKEELNKINKLLENSYFMAIPGRNTFKLKELSTKLKEKKWIRKYPIYRRFFDASKYGMIDKALSILNLLSINRRDLERLEVTLKNKNLSDSKIKKAIKKWNLGNKFVL